MNCQRRWQYIYFRTFRNSKQQKHFMRKCLWWKLWYDVSSEQKHSKETVDSQFETVQKQNRSSNLLRVASESDMNISTTRASNDSKLSKRTFSNWRWKFLKCNVWASINFSSSNISFKIQFVWSDIANYVPSSFFRKMKQLKL